MEKLLAMGNIPNIELYSFNANKFQIKIWIRITLKDF